MKDKNVARKAVVVLILVTSVVLLGIGSYFIINEMSQETNTSTNE